MEPISLPAIALGPPEPFYRLTPPELPVRGEYYFLSNDAVAVHLTPPPHDPVVFWGVANPHFFHVLALVAQRCPIQRAVAIDANPEQLRHFCRLHHLITTARHRIDFLERLFMVRFNHRARQALAALAPGRPATVRGSRRHDPYLRLERCLWANCDFDAAGFRQRYHLTATPTEQGLRIHSRTIGAINTYYATCACAARDAYDAWPFTAGYGSGFLASEKSLHHLQAVLRTVPVYAVSGDICDLYPTVVASNRYHPMVFWASNLLCDWFTERHPPLAAMATELERLGSQREPCFPELDLVVLQDQRTARPLAPAVTDHRRRQRPLSNHSRTFRRLCAHLEGYDNLEVVNVPAWIEEDHGVSKLANTRYLLLDDFLRPAEERLWDTIVLHILLGHGATTATFRRAAQKALRLGRRLVVLEHNRQSRDFRHQGIGVTPTEIRRLLGRETVLDFAPGERSAHRNLIMVYPGHADSTTKPMSR